MTVGQNVLMRDASGAIVAGKPVAGCSRSPKIMCSMSSMAHLTWMSRWKLGSTDQWIIIPRNTPFIGR